MQINYIQNHKQSFGIKIAPEALATLRKFYIGNVDSKGLFFQTPILKLLKETETDKVVLNKLIVHNNSAFRARLTYKIDELPYWYEENWINHADRNVAFSDNHTTEFQSYMACLTHKLLSRVMSSLAKEGKLKRSLAKIRKDFCSSQQLTEEYWQKFKSLDELHSKNCKNNSVSDMFKDLFG